VVAQLKIRVDRCREARRQLFFPGKCLKNLGSWPGICQNWATMSFGFVPSDPVATAQSDILDKHERGIVRRSSSLPCAKKAH